MAPPAAEGGPAPLLARELPVTTKLPLERANPLLSCAVSKWLKAHGKTVKPKLSEEQRSSLALCFKMMDSDGSGAIDAQELESAFKLLGFTVSRREVEAMLNEVDRDGSGEVEYAEFLEIMTLQLTRLAESGQKQDDEQQRRQQQRQKREVEAAEAARGKRASQRASRRLRRRDLQQRGAEAGQQSHKGSADGEGSGEGTCACGSGSSADMSSSDVEGSECGEYSDANSDMYAAEEQAVAGGSCGSSGTSPATNLASVLPFEVVATAYRRKKLMEALETDDKDFILSVAAAEEEEKRRAQAEAEALAATAAAAAAASAADRRSRRPSQATPQPGGGEAERGSSQRGGRPKSTARGGGGFAQLPRSHASFLDSLSKEERRIIDTLSRKYRDEQDVMTSQAEAQWRQQQKQRFSPAGCTAATSGTAGAAAAAAAVPGDHLAALQRTASRADVVPALPLRPGSAAAVRREDFKIQYRFSKSTPAGSGGQQAAAAVEAASPGDPAAVAAEAGSVEGSPVVAAVAAVVGDATLGLMLAVPMFSSKR